MDQSAELLICSTEKYPGVWPHPEKDSKVVETEEGRNKTIGQAHTNIPFIITGKLFFTVMPTMADKRLGANLQLHLCPAGFHTQNGLQNTHLKAKKKETKGFYWLVE